jgi:epoxyqueuosine reductase
MRQKLKQLCLRIEQEIGPFLWRPFSDSAPIMEHALAEQAGLGFIGKHSLLIHPEAGSTFFLGEILCNLPLPTHTSPIKSGCGPCQKCLHDCPTQAIVAPFTVDARRCISYLTIEYEGSIAPDLRPLIGNRIYGCDDCQLTCPWNKFSQLPSSPDFAARHQLDNIMLLELWQWTEKDFLLKMEGSPIRRIGFERWRRNLAIALGNSTPSIETQQQLEHALTDASALVQEHIIWALKRQNQPRHLTEIPVLVHRSYLN